MGLRTLVAFLGALAFAGAACGSTESTSGGDAEDSPAPVAPGRATLKPQGMNPLVVVGAGFVPREHVSVSTDGAGVKEVRADSRGRFVVRFTDAETCSGVVVVARGSGGSRASFSLAHVSNVHCL